MDTGEFEDMLQQLVGITVCLEKDVAELRVSIAALTVIVADQLNPDDPSEGAKHIQKLEDAAREADPTAEKRQKISDALDAIKLMRKHGGYYET